MSTISITDQYPPSPRDAAEQAPSEEMIETKKLI